MFGMVAVYTVVVVNETRGSQLPCVIVTCVHEVGYGAMAVVGACIAPLMHGGGTGNELKRAVWAVRSVTAAVSIVVFVLRVVGGGPVFHSVWSCVEVFTHCIRFGSGCWLLHSIELLLRHDLDELATIRSELSKGCRAARDQLSHLIKSSRAASHNVARGHGGQGGRDGRDERDEGRRLLSQEMSQEMPQEMIEQMHKLVGYFCADTLPQTQVEIPQAGDPRGAIMSCATRRAASFENAAMPLSVALGIPLFAVVSSYGMLALSQLGNLHDWLPVRPNHLWILLCTSGHYVCLAIAYLYMVASPGASLRACVRTVRQYAVLLDTLPASVPLIDRQKQRDLAAVIIGYAKDQPTACGVTLVGGLRASSGTWVWVGPVVIASASYIGRMLANTWM